MKKHITSLLFALMAFVPQMFAQDANQDAPSVQVKDIDGAPINFNTTVEKGKITVVSFWATWCGPCKTMAPILEEVATEAGDNARIIKIDVDKNPNVAAQYQIRGVPTLILFKNGKILWQQSGVVPGHQLKQILQQHA